MKMTVMAALLATTLGGVVPAAFAVESINGNANVMSGSWRGASDVGWFYTPTVNYVLTGVDTRFGSVDGRTVTVEIYDELPINGGHLLRSGTYSANSTGFAGAVFAGLQLIAGEDYFIGFRNVLNMGLNITDDVNATILPDDLYFTSVGDSEYYTRQDATPEFRAPILQLHAAPEPGSLALLGLGMAVAGVLRRRAR
ncbi:MAG TPA: PEP-CTERM sorting domain-containing protein [Accumulibacter sp.]|jgi:hypothetical protein|nr:PEP-CTERM sorting domain-containing protein [Accumulibacter sp.]HQC80617.1 PEP-CTERM sorting domain-containing protein [Accumulibacter sp.]